MRLSTAKLQRVYVVSTAELADQLGLDGRIVSITSNLTTVPGSVWIATEEVQVQAEKGARSADA